MEIDLHIHSMFSNDSRSRPEAIVRKAAEVGLGAIAVTDHNSWRGARTVASIAPRSLIVIPGAEIKTDKGDILALFVNDEIETRNWASAVEDIRSRGGVSIVPHPFDSPKLSKEDIVLADGIEVFNSTCSNRSNRLAAELASELRKPGFASSDAHMVVEIGNGRTKVDDVQTLEELRNVVLARPEVSRTTRSNPLIHRANEAIMFGLKGIWRR